MPLAEITTLISSVKTAYDIAKGINSLKIEVERNESISKILQILLSVQFDALSMQENYQTLLNEKETIAKRLVETEKWDETESQYDLMRMSVGTFVRTPNKNHQSPEPLHWLCANCFDKKKKSLLQKMYWTDDSPMICPECKTVIHLGIKEHELIRR